MHKHFTVRIFQAFCGFLDSRSSSPPEDDKYGYESAAERWSPVQTPETILLSVISMLSSPNDESPANVEAARLWREDSKEFRKRCRANVRASLGEE